MPEYSTVEMRNEPEAAVKAVLKAMLSKGLVDAVVVPARTPYSSLPMPTLFSDVEKLQSAAPLAPVAPFNAARQAASVTRNPTGKNVALVLRPCEIRALVELVKLRQCALEQVIVIGIDCLGRMENEVFLECAEKHDDITSAFYKGASLRERITGTCKTCDRFVPQGADITIAFFGMDPSEGVGLVGETEQGNKVISGLGLAVHAPSKTREGQIAVLMQQRSKAKEDLFAKTSDRIRSMGGLQKILANCLNCYNCRTACPVCYCKACVFATDVFLHDPEVLIRRSQKKGAVKLPTDTTMFHITRLAHMAHACVGCGQCSSVCPSGLPVSDIFRTVSARVQHLFDYVPGRDPGEPIPYLVFKEEE